MEPEQYELLRRHEERHWFFRGQGAIAAALLSPHLQRRDGRTRILDAGCGTGGSSLRLTRFGTVIGMDLSALAVTAAHARGLCCVRSSVTSAPFADGSFDVVTCFDVLYHRGVGDDLRALREFHRVLRPQGLLLVRVPAFEFFRRAHDCAVHTRHRYTRRELAAKLQATHYAVRVVTYANTLLLPLIATGIMLERIHGPRESDLSLPPAPLNRIFTFLLWLEARALTRIRFPVGLSVVALAERL